jgi:hypothetical protein
MFKIFSDGSDEQLRLEDPAGRTVGWIRGHTIGFGGLPSEKRAVRAAVDAWPSLETTLQRDYPGRESRPLNRSKVDLVRDAGAEWIAHGGHHLARLLRPLSGRNSADSFALEFFVPSYATQHVTIAAAQAVAKVVSQYVTVDTPELFAEAV